MRSEQSPCRTVREIHTEAMGYAEEADLLSRTDGDSDRVRELFRQAAELEKQALDIVRGVPNNEPTFSILDMSYRSLDLMAQGRITEAKHLEE